MSFTYYSLFSRCVVCVSDYKLMAVHSFRSQKPNLNKLEAAGWQELYSGYSYIYQSGAREGSGTEFGAHGSCLEYFSPVSIVQTNGLEVRWISNSPTALWIIDYEKLRNYDLDDGSLINDVRTGAARSKFRETELGRCVVMRRTSTKRKVVYFSPHDRA